MILLKWLTKKPFNVRISLFYSSTFFFYRFDNVLSETDTDEIMHIEQWTYIIEFLPREIFMQIR